MNSIPFVRHLSLMQWIRILIGLYFIYQGITLKDGFSAFIGSFLILQGVTNTGCCGAGGCNTTIKKST